MNLKKSLRRFGIAILIGNFALKTLVRPGRIERPTHSLEGCCSIQLSYGRLLQNSSILIYTGLESY